MWSLIDRRAADLVSEVKAAYQLQASQRGLPATEPAVTADQREAAATMVEQVAGAGGGRGGRGGGGGGGGGRGGRGAGGPSLPTEFNAEFNILLGKHLSALEIRDFLSGEFTPLPLSNVMAVLQARQTAGQITLTKK